MNRPFKKIWKETIVIALAFILLGCFMLMQPDKTIAFFSYLIGALIIVLAALAFYRHYTLHKMITFELLYGIICSVGAILIFLNQSIIETLIPIVLGIVMIANSIFKIQYIFDLKREGIEKWYISLLLSLGKIVLGIVMVTNPLASVMALTQMIAVVVILFAICDVIDLILISYYLKEDLKQEATINEKQIQEASYEEIEYEEK